MGEYNNTHHKKIKMTPVCVKDNTYIDWKKEINGKDSKVKVGDHVRISKLTPNWSEDFFVNKKIKNTVPPTYVINDLNGEEIMRKFYVEELQKNKHLEFRIEKVIKR